MSQVLQVRNLRKAYGGQTVAVDRISFDLARGEILGLLGPNGSGKTTTIQMLLGTLVPSSGSISYFGRNFHAHRSEILQQVSFASTYTSLPSNLTIRENLDVISRLYGMSPQEGAARYLPLLERFGMQDRIHMRVASLSAGQVTRLMLVKAFFTEPKIALLDEPTASLDPDIAHEICLFLIEERKRRDISILFTSHKMDEAALLCDRTIFLKSGKIIADDLPRNLARSVASHRLRLIVPDQMIQLEAIAKKLSYPYQIEGQAMEISLDEKEIASLFQTAAREGILYTQVQIEEPSLEHFFLQISRHTP